MKSHILKYYNDYNKIIIKPKIYFEIKKPSSRFFILEWIEFTGYFKKILEVLNYYIIRCLIKNFYSTTKDFSARELITKVVKNLNLYIFDKIHYDYFFVFDDTINRLKYLEKIILENQSFSTDKKYEFVYFLISTLDILQEIIIIFNQNNILPYSNYTSDPLYFYNNTYKLNFIPFTGGIKNNNKIKSFWITDTCISNYHFLQFIKNSGYLTRKLWSKEGYNWSRLNNIYKPDNWKYIENKWYINNLPIEEVYNYPIEKITYYEAEACANFYDCRLPSEEEWEWVATNRNKTTYPNGIELPLFFEFSCNFSNVESIDGKGCKSLMEMYQLYGNVWEFTNTLSISDNIEVCLKGGDRHIPTFVLNSNLKMYIERDSNEYCVSFRMIKN